MVRRVWAWLKKRLSTGGSSSASRSCAAFRASAALEPAVSSSEYSCRWRSSASAPVPPLQGRPALGLGEGVQFVPAVTPVHRPAPGGQVLRGPREASRKIVSPSIGALGADKLEDAFHQDGPPVGLELCKPL